MRFFVTRMERSEYSENHSIIERKLQAAVTSLTVYNHCLHVMMDCHNMGKQNVGKLFFILIVFPFLYPLASYINEI